MGINVKALDAKEAALRDLILQHALLIQALYGVMKSLAVKEIAF